MERGRRWENCTLALAHFRAVALPTILPRNRSNISPTVTIASASSLAILVLNALFHRPARPQPGPNRHLALMCLPCATPVPNMATISGGFSGLRRAAIALFSFRSNSVRLAKISFGFNDAGKSGGLGEVVGSNPAAPTKQLSSYIASRGSATVQLLPASDL